MIDSKSFFSVAILCSIFSGCGSHLEEDKRILAEENGETTEYTPGYFEEITKNQNRTSNLNGRDCFAELSLGKLKEQGELMDVLSGFLSQTCFSRGKPVLTLVSENPVILQTNLDCRLNSMENVLRCEGDFEQYVDSGRVVLPVLLDPNKDYSSLTGRIEFLEAKLKTD